MQDVMKTPILEKDGVMKEKDAETTNIGIFTVDPQHPVYQDPFYANDSTVIASFPFEQSSFGVAIHSSSVVVILCLAFIFLYVVSDEDTFSLYLLVWIVILFPNLMALRTYITTREYHRRAHIAIATTGIYLDEATKPGSRTLKNRQVFKYEDYQQCYVQKRFTGNDSNVLEYDVMLKKKNSIEPPMVLVKGLLGTQTFVDQVNALIEGMANGDAFVAAERLELGTNVAQDQNREGNLVVTNGVALGNRKYPISQDTFYENDTTVIASFALDQQIFDKLMMRSSILMFVLLALSVILIILAFRMDFEGLFFLAMVPFFIFFVLSFYRSVIHQVQFARSCTHIAIAETGVYVDTVSHPRSRIHMSRTVFLYEDYDSCYMEESRNSGFCGYLEYRIMLKKRNHSDPPVILAWGMLEPHLFAEKVLAMIEQTAERATPTMPIASQV